MKRNLLLAFIIALYIPLLGNPVDETTAKQLAQNFWKENNIMGVRGDKVFKKKMIDARFVNVAPQCGYSEFFIFNNENGKGFVIIAADDCVTPILGYSYDNNFAVENLPPNLKGWLDGYAEQIRMAVEMKVMATDEIRADWECLRQKKNLPIRSETAVSELLSTTWGQAYPYSYYCPYNSFYSQYTYTGCVATAMAQIMNYWEYPTHGYGFNEYYCFPYGMQSANFGNTIYDWNNMLNDYSGNYNSIQRNAVAKLMYHCGVSVNMDYGVNASSSHIIANDYSGYYEYCAENAFTTFFGYDSSTIQGLERNNFSDSNWINLLKTDLNNNRPILYGGQGSGGHAFVCDGYDNSNYFHFNWGWCGDGQGANNNYGYFNINYLTPIDQYNNVHNYSNYQVALIGIQPNSNLQNYNLVLYDDVQMVGDVFGNYDFGQSISAYAEILNNGNSTFSGYIAAAVFDNNGYFIDFLGGGYTSLEPNYWTSDIVEHEGGIPFLPSYEYLYHTVMFYSTNGENWTIINSGNYSNDGIFQVLNNGEDIVANSEFIISTGEDILFNGQTATINIDVINEGSATYYGSIWLCLTNYDTNSSQTIGIIDIDDGLPVNYHFANGLDFTNTISLPEGLYYLELLYIKDDHLHYAGSVIYPCIKRVYVSNSPYSINATANPSDGGSITGLGDYFEGETCILTATANNGYSFVNWTENGTQVSTNANYSFTVTGNRNLVANFQAQPQQYTINVSASPNNGGNVTGGGTYQQGQTCTVSATANSGYTFINWTENGTQVSTNANYSFTVTNNRNLVAHFTTQNYVITAIADPTAGGIVTGSGGYNYGESCTLSATANTGYTFINWTKNGTQVSSNPTYTFTVTETATYIAHFSAQSYIVTTAASPSTGGTTTGGGTYNYGQTCTVTASAANGYAFTNWTENGTQVSTNANYSFTVTGNRNLVANFAQSAHTITATAGVNGIITPSGTITVTHGANQSFAMIPDEGYEVQDVYIDGNSVGPMISYTFTNVTADHYIHVTFVHVDGIGENNNMSIVVYPNPTQGEVMVESEGLSHIRIVNAYGQTVYNADVEGQQVRIDLSQMGKGIYMMHIEANDGHAVRKIVVE